MDNRELRFASTSVNSSSDEMILEGYAIVFNQRTLLYEVDGVQFHEVIESSALDHTDLKDVCLKYNHSDNAKILARTRNNTLEINIDDKGLFIRAKLADTTDSRDIYNLVKRGDLDKMSFAFTINDEEFRTVDNTRVIKGIDKVFEVSIVDVPAYEGTSIVAKRCMESMQMQANKELRNSLINSLKGTKFDDKEYIGRCSMADLKDTIKELKEMEERKEIANKLNNNQSVDTILRGNMVGQKFNNNVGGNKMENKEMFAGELLEKRSALVSANVLVPKFYNTDIIPSFNSVSGILELVRKMPVVAGNGLKVPYVKSTSTGNITDEGALYEETPTEFGSVDIDAVKITAYMEYSEEVEKLPTAQYEGYIVSELSKIIERKVVQQIAKGNGNKQFKGLYDTSIADASSDIEISTIDSKTLNTIVYSHNTGAEEVEGNNILFLNKKDLGAFASVQDSDGRPVYNIIFSDNGMTGHINGVKFCICNSLDSFADAAATKYTMVYLDPAKYMVASFGNIDLKKDYSAGFKNGIVGVKASMFAGGSIVSPSGVSRIKKA